MYFKSCEFKLVNEINSNDDKLIYLQGKMNFSNKTFEFCIYDVNGDVIDGKNAITINKNNSSALSNI